MTEKLELLAFKGINRFLKTVKTIRRGPLYEDLSVLVLMAAAVIAVGNMMATLLTLTK